METHKLELIFKQSLYRNERCTISLTDYYYLDIKDFEYLIEDNICDDNYIINNRQMRIELIVVSNQSDEYKMAVCNSGLNKKAQEARKEIEEYWGQPFRLSDLSRAYLLMNNP